MIKLCVTTLMMLYFGSPIHAVTVSQGFIGLAICTLIFKVEAVNFLQVLTILCYIMIKSLTLRGTVHYLEAKDQ